MNGPRMAGKATFLAGIIDDRSRFLTGCQFVRRADAVRFAGVLRAAISRHGTPDAGVGCAPAEVVLDQLGCGIHQRDPPGLGTFAVQRHYHRAGDADVAGVQVADLLDAGGGVVERGKQDRVALPAPGGWVWFGQEGFDLVAGQVAHVSGGGFLLLDSDDLGGLAGELWPLDGGVADERPDGGQALVPGGRRVAALSLQPVQERQDPRPVDVGEAQFPGRDCLHVAEPGEQQPDRVPVGRDGLGRHVPLGGQVAGEEPRQPPAGQVAAGGLGRLTAGLLAARPGPG